jgi:single-strand DNA-binding protein
MASLNKVMLIGNLGKDPEMRMAGENPVANFTLATAMKDKTEWHRIVAWGKTAELCGQYLSKGRQVYIEGRIQTREWVDKEGAKKFTTEVVASNIVFLGKKDDSGVAAVQPPGSTYPQPHSPSMGEVPF